ncbi:MAG: amidohydrolase [Bacteroidota bacterium]
MEPLHLTLLQIPLAWHQAGTNRHYIQKILEDLDQESDVILLPEMFTTGFTMEVEHQSEDMEGPSIDWMNRMAQLKKCWIGGSLIIKEEGSYYNRFIMMSPDGIVGEYDKRHLFRMAKEHDYFMEGEEFVRLRLKGWNIVPMVCYDLRFPVWSRNRLDGEGRLAADLMLYVANWPARRQAHWDILLQARAIENQCYIAGVNRVGKDQNDIEYSGSSAIIDPKGQVLQHLVHQEGILRQVLDPEMMTTYREKFPAWKDADVFDLSI